METRVRRDEKEMRPKQFKRLVASPGMSRQVRDRSREGQTDRHEKQTFSKVMFVYW